MVELGDEVKCMITGYQGIVTSHAKCLTGCDRITVRGPMKKEGTMGEEYWFDIESVEIVKKHKVRAASVQSQQAGKKGGPPTRSNLK